MSSVPRSFPSRFRIRRELGAGGFGVVYEADDVTTGSVVALKKLRRLEPDALYRFKAEFRALADLLHPNLVRFHELFAVGDDWYFTMEHVEGTPFRRHVRGESASDADSGSETPTIAGAVDPASRTVASAAQPPRNLDVLRDALRQLARGVHALHESGRLHRDLKSSNVLVTADGRVVVLDLGLVTSVGDALTSDDGAMISGTPAYMAPEQAASARSTTASDWYAVGVMTYEALVGRLPFEGAAQDVMYRKQLLDPVDPRLVVPGLPDDLCDLTMRLLRRDPDDRPTPQEILESLDPRDERESSVPPFAPRGLSEVVPMVGRRLQLAALEACFADARPGAAVVAVLSGPSGMGKSTVAKSFVEWARSRASAVLEGRCGERESVPYRALDPVVDSLVKHLLRLPAEATTALLSPDAAALARLFPVVARIDAIRDAPARADAPDPREVRRRAFDALRETLSRMSTARPIVVLLDDVQAGDADSAALLVDLLRPPDAPSLVVVACHREDPDARDELLPKLRADLASVGVAMRDIEVGPLTHDESRRLATALLDADSPTLSDDAETVARESEGNPFFVHELARVSGRATLREALSQRFERLADGERRLLEFVAIAGCRMASAIIVHAARIAHAEQTSLLATLAAKGLVRTSGGERGEQVETTHDRIRDAIVAELDVEARRERHRALAEALEEATVDDPESLVAHWQAAGEPERGRRHALLGAERAEHALAFDRAAQLYRVALADAPAGDLRALQLRLAESLANAGRGPESARAFLDARAGATDEEALVLQRAAGEQLLRAGHIDEGVATLREVLERVGVRFPTHPLYALFLVIGGLIHLRLRGFRYVPRAALTPTDALRLDVCWAAGVGFANVDRVLGMSFLVLHLQLALRSGDERRIAKGLLLHGIVLAVGGGRSTRRADELTTTALGIAERLDDPYLLCSATVARAVVMLCTHRFRACLETFERAIVIMRDRCGGDAWAVGNMYVYSLNTLLFLGDYREAARRAPRLVAEARERGDLFSTTLIQTMAMPSIWLLSDEPEEARRESAEAIRQWSKRGFYLQHAYDVCTQAQVRLYEGAGGEAFAIVDAGITRMRRALLLRSQHMRIFARFVRGRCAAAAAIDAERGDRRSYIAHAKRDVRALRAEGTRYSDGCASLVAAGIAQANGEVDEAIAELSRAEASFVEADMDGFAAPARWRRAKLVGGEAGASQVREVEASFAEHGVADPARWAGMVAPGISR